VPDRDLLGACVAVTAIVGVLGLSVLIGPRPLPPVEVAPEPEPVIVVPEEPTVEEPEEPAEPVRLVPLQVRIGAIAVDAPIVPVGLEPDGAMEIPERVREIGWYDPDGIGVAPGMTGTAVLAGHVDSRTQGRGALYDLRNLRVGEIIEVDLEDGTTQRWLITEVIQYDKTDLPLHEIFTWAGPARLALITCGGVFDRTARSYTDNLVVYAEPLASSDT
jgi:hypothetical protein